jgi:hypothetical protein
MQIPLAYTVSKSGFLISVWPTLPTALDAARDRFSRPSVMLEVTVWFPDGTSREIQDTLCTPDRSDWITREQASQLEHDLFPINKLPAP